MFTKFGNSVNGVKIGFQYEGFEFSKDRKYARITKPLCNHHSRCQHCRSQESLDSFGFCHSEAKWTR